jgi:hypothetical protein
MKKAHFNALEKVFSNEVEQSMKPRDWPRFPFQSKAKVFTELQGLGLLRQDGVMCGKGAFRVNVTGWALTEAGRLAYCSECKDESEAA